MSYKIITDPKALREFIETLPDLENNEKFYGCLFSRKKYLNDKSNAFDKQQLKSFVAGKWNLFNKIHQLEAPLGSYQGKNGPVPQESLALYIMPNPRCMRKATIAMGKKMWEMIEKEKYNLRGEATGCIQRSPSRKIWVDFDIDTKDVQIKGLDGLHVFLETELGPNNYSLIETRGGYHLLVKPKFTTEYRKKYNMPLNWHQIISERVPYDQCGDQLIPMPGTYQGGFTPKIII